MKRCNKCEEIKSVTEFSISRRIYGDGFQSQCKSCQSAYYKAYRLSRSLAEATSHPQSKVCLECHLEKPISQFGKKSASSDKHNNYCIPCWRIVSKKAILRQYKKQLLGDPNA
jgi:hypothetical protein